MTFIFIEWRILSTPSEGWHRLFFAEFTQHRFPQNSIQAGLIAFPGTFKPLHDISINTH